MNLSILENAGINTSELMHTLLENEDVLKTVLDKFLSDKNYKELERLFSSDQSDMDYKAVELYAHTLKGASATLEMSELHICLQGLVDDVRTGKYNKLKEDFAIVTAEYNKVRNAILEWKKVEEVS